MARATGESAKQSGLISEVVAIKRRALTPQAAIAGPFPRRRCRAAVRGFLLSISQSVIRLKSIAAVRAKTMQSRIRPKILQPGKPLCALAATSMEPSANGSAKTVCENRMKVRKREREEIKGQKSESEK